MERPSRLFGHHHCKDVRGIHFPEGWSGRENTIPDYNLIRV
jgi:hypothetical protein